MITKPLKILDVGGTEIFWGNMGFNEEAGVKILLLNLSKVEVTYPNFQSMVGNGRDMRYFHDKQFDIIFSNSVIEHVGDYNQQRKMADEIKRVGVRYFVQTPNRYFPIEPHFLFPLFQFLPLKIKIFLIRHINLGWFRKIDEKEKAIETIKSIRLLSEKDLKNLFPDAAIYKEKYFGLTKSFVVYKG